MYQKNHKDILVSTIIPSYNKHHFLKEALFSVLNQTHENQEIIIVNDYPTWEARDEINKFAWQDKRITVLHNTTNIGIAPSRNKAISYASWKYYAMLDHDDIRHDPDKITKQINILENDKNIWLVWTWYYDVDRNLHILRKCHFPLDDTAIRNRLNIAMPWLHSTFLFSANAMTKVWWFNEAISMTDDYEILFRILQVGKMQNLPEYTTLYRAHENTSRDRKNAAIMRHNSFKTLIKNWYQYPNYSRAVLIRLLRSYPYSMIRPYLSDTLVDNVKEIRNYLLWRPSQLYNRINDQDEALEQ